MIVNIYKNKLIALEGIGGVGKTTVSKFLVEDMNRLALQPGNEVLDLDSIVYDLRGLVDKKDISKVLKDKLNGGTIRFDDISVNYPTTNLLSNLEQQDDMMVSYFTYMLSALYKNKVIASLLPYLNIVCDRYIYSVISQHLAYGCDICCIDLDHFPIIKPDVCILFTTNEQERQRRIKQRGIKHSKDKQKKVKGSVIEKIENIFKKIIPISIDTTHLSPKIISKQILDMIRK